ncbi:hypothetical protein E5676_scaffold204G00140 [Cucumis melo var. makuwa]|uniref:Uncharacterized protein n=1 Tax=Cucumis melo var. makuwa TaxID=1194695 RepID=A0A5D3D5J2_CUCMM|nr:hypothetical protein E5676_scaffold204G00140 [Cucumis melo var. makuwa]
MTGTERIDSEQEEGETSCHHITILEELEIEIREEDVEDAPQSLEDDGQSTVDKLKEVNLGTIEEPRSTFISASLSSGEEGKYMSFLTEYKDTFAWSYKEMLGLDPKVAVHHPAIKPRYQPIKQVQRRFRPELISQIEIEVKSIEAGFIYEVKYPTWIANIVPVRKKNGQLCVYVDFRDLNNACPKDDFPLSITKIMVNSTTGHEVMPFELKNVGATYQRAMQKVFDDMLHKYIECYVDDIALRMNPLKYAFGVTSGKFLGFIEFTVHLVAKADPIKYVMSRSIIFGCLAKWAILLQQYDIDYIPQKAIKGQVLADFLEDQPIPSDWKLCEDLPDDEAFFIEVMKSWTMYFDDAARRSSVGAGIALIIGLQMALEIGVSFIKINDDSKLIINQLSLQYDMKHEDLKPYFAYTQQLMERFDSVMLKHVPRTENKRVDALANLATILKMPDDVALNIPLWLFFQCIGKEESIKVLREAHAGICRAHQSRPKLQFQLRRMGYYWPQMVQDSMDYATKCEARQYHANFIHQPPEPLHPIVASWPFEA